MTAIIDDYWVCARCGHKVRKNNAPAKCLVTYLDAQGNEHTEMLTPCLHKGCHHALELPRNYFTTTIQING